MLYLFLWQNLDLVVSDGKGESALDDWQADKTITLPDLRGRSIIGAGSGNGLSDRALGSQGGSETHQLSINEMPSHSHSMSAIVFTGAGSALSNHYQNVRYSSSSSTSATGGNAAHNNMPPWLALSWIIKY